MSKRGLFGLRVYVFDNGEYEANNRIFVVAKSLSEAAKIWKNDYDKSGTTIATMRRDRGRQRGRLLAMDSAYEEWSIYIYPFETNVAY